jgi:hypothetical protein
MKAKKIYLPLTVVMLIAGGIYIYFFTGPYRFVESSIAEESLQHLRSAAGSGASWLASPSETAFEYLYWWPQIDRPNRAKLDIATSYQSSDEAIVTVIDNDTRDDSISRDCVRITLRRQSGFWIPVRQQAAWQGRGRFGWTTKPAL